MNVSTQVLAAAYREACVLDVQSSKPGNVSLASPGHGMCAEDFVRSAEQSAPAITQAGLALGERIYRAVLATHEAVGCNTNLGIVLLCAPLIQACQDYPRLPLRDGVRCVLADTTVQDAELVYRAIRLVSPGGLGELDEHDVAQCARLSLKDAMAEAAGRDLIARQYANGFVELFDDVQPYLAAATGRHEQLDAAMTDLFLSLLARYPDTHLRRKHGAEVAEGVARMAAKAHWAYARQPDAMHGRSSVAGFDSALKRYGLNPGTSADLCVAGFLIHRLHQQADPSTGELPGNSRTTRPTRAQAPQTANSQQYEGETKWR